MHGFVLILGRITVLNNNFIAKENGNMILENIKTFKNSIFKKN